MNHNFADFELTKFLPRRNTYTKPMDYGKSWYAVNKLEYCSDTKQFISTERLRYELMSHGFMQKNLIEYVWEKDAWTFGDIRLYLESKGYYLGRSFNTDNIKEGIVDVWVNKKGYEPYLKLSFGGINYEKAREEAIKYCLNKINNEK